MTLGCLYMARYVRIVAEPTIDNPDTAPLFLDLAINFENEIVGSNAIFAFQGDMNNSHGRSLPFVLLSDGKADFGEEYDSSDRYGELNLRDGKIFEGRLLRFHGNGYDERFRIKRVIPLSEELRYVSLQPKAFGLTILFINQSTAIRPMLSARHSRPSAAKLRERCPAFVLVSLEAQAELLPLLVEGLAAPKRGAALG